MGSVGSIVPSPHGVGTPMDFNRAYARPARAFIPSRYVLTSSEDDLYRLSARRQWLLGSITRRCRRSMVESRLRSRAPTV